MKIFLAYVIVIPLVQFALLLGGVLGFLSALLLSWIPDKIGVPIRCFAGGCARGITAIGFGFIVFRWLAGAESFGFFPFLATAVPLSGPISNDYHRYRELKQELSSSLSNSKPLISAFAKEFVSANVGCILGDIIGILIGGYLFTGR